MTAALITRDKCVWCDRIKEEIRKYPEVQAYEYNLSLEPVMLDFIRSAGFKTVPIFFHKGKVIGGYEDTVKYLGGMEDGT